MPKTEKQGKCRVRYPQKGIANSKPSYFVRIDAVEVKWFTTQTEAFAFALGKGLSVWKKEPFKRAEKVSLCPQVEGRMKKEEKKEKVTRSKTSCNK